MKNQDVLTLRYVFGSFLGTDTQESFASSLRRAIVTVCCAPSLGMVVKPGTPNVAETSPMLETIAGWYIMDGGACCCTADRVTPWGDLELDLEDREYDRDLLEAGCMIMGY